jgi:hypothetical protein
MQPDRLSPKIFLSIGFFFLILILAFHSQIKEGIDFELEKLSTYKYNFFASNNPEVMKRPRPISTTAKESQIEMFAGKPFSEFEGEDWIKFWEVIYGVYPKQEPEKPGLPMKMRQLTESEIASELITLYPRPFRNFSDQDWNNFFRIISGK